MGGRIMDGDGWGSFSIPDLTVAWKWRDGPSVEGRATAPAATAAAAAEDPTTTTGLHPLGSSAVVRCGPRLEAAQVNGT